MKKFLLFIILVFIGINSLTINSYAASEFDYIWNLVDEDTKEYLNELGIDEISFNELYSITPTRLIEFLLSTIFSSGINIIDKLVSIVVIIFLTAIVLSFINENESTESIITFVSTMAIVSILIIPIIRIFYDAASAINTTFIFVNGYLPVMCAVIIASKNPSLAFTYNSYTIFFSSLITTSAEKLLLPVLKTILIFNIVSSFSQEDFKDRIIKTVNRLVTIVLSLFSTIFTGLLTTQSILAVSSDSVIMRGIKLVSGAVVPIVGGGVGDAISSVFSSFLIMKNTLGVFVIIVILLINLPVIIELLILYFFIGLCSIFSSIMNLNKLSKTLDSISSVIALINIIVFFVTFILIISTGVIIMIGK